VPDIGDFKDVPVIEVFVKVGDTVKAEDSLVSLESEKATMDVPAPSAGVVKELKVKLGDKVSEGTVILMLEATGGGAQAVAPAPSTAPASTPAPAAAAPTPPAPTPAATPAPAPDRSASFKSAHASLPCARSRANSASICRG
jgi:pyruvate dehydrogenase E2 component (dihydrolipoamide acetyltransferase)